MRKTKLLSAAIFVIASFANGRYIHGVNWADETVSCTSRIQSWADGQCGGPGPNFISLQTPQTSWWVLGPADADGNSNMKAWDFDKGDRDYVAGWRGGSPINAEQEIVVFFENALEDKAGSDLIIRLFCGPAAKASVYVSSDLSSFAKVGEIEGSLNGVPGKGGFLYDAEFDFSEKYSEPVHYVKVYREVTASQSGMFFDSFRSAHTKLPQTKAEVIHYGWTILQDTNSDCYTDNVDFAQLAESWKICYDPQTSEFSQLPFEDPNSIPSSCHGVWQAGFGMEADINRDCTVNIQDLILFAEKFLTCTDPSNENCIKPWKL
ncbi:hypothetical protein L21SP3_00670 [Sedimentisphaera cyanobacteriorum]|uniref:Uncharacterized protein n=2 Tax=Sedimentisphaera cyanobacteriorum TaxID=1940790 RepID=A0A1Q2HN24_9BACT|nr:hypothetical protein L21SP3_00670 [Sedimentisphaera cyanobacteriorum]